MTIRVSIGVFVVALVLAQLATQVWLFGSYALAQDRSQQWSLCSTVDGPEVEASIKACTELIEAGSVARHQRATALINRGRAYLARGDYVRSIRDFDAALALDPSLAAAVRYRADAYAAEGRLNLAVENYNKAIDLAPTDILARLGRARTHLRHVQVLQSIDDWDGEILAGTRRGLSQHFWSIQDPDLSIGLNPADVSAYTKPSVINQRREPLQKAIADYDEVIRTRPAQAAPYAERGAAWLVQGDLELAIKDFDEAIRLDPSHILALTNRGTAWRDRGQPSRAVEDYDQVIRLSALDAAAFTNRGSAFIDMGQHVRAIVDFNEAIRLNPRYARAFRARGAAYARMGEYERAQQDFTIAIGLSPASNPAALRLRCRVRAIQRQIELALQDCAAASRKRPDHPGTLDNQGLARLYAGRNDAAIADFTASLRLQPRRPTALYGRGIARRRNGDTAGADDIAAALAINGDIARGMDAIGAK